MNAIDNEYRVEFVGDYFYLSVPLQGVETHNEDAIIDLANNIMVEHYGFDAKAMATIDIEVERAF